MAMAVAETPPQLLGSTSALITRIQVASRADGDSGPSTAEWTAIAAALRCPAQSLDLQVAGGLQWLQQAVASVGKGGSPARDAAVLCAVAACARWPDSAFEMGKWGTHRAIVALCDGEAASGVGEAAAEAAGVCVTSLAGDAVFPMRAGLVDGADLAWRRPYAAYLRDAGPHRFRPGTFQELASGAARCVVARPVPRRSSWMGSTGYKLWNCAIPLARWLHDRRADLSCASVLEIGAGLGVPGLYAAQHAHSVTLTDYEDATLHNLCCNAALAISLATALTRAGAPRGDVHATAVGRRGGVRCARMDWGAIDCARLVRDLRAKLPASTPLSGEPPGGAPPSSFDADARKGAETIAATAGAWREGEKGAPEAVSVEAQSALAESSFDIILVSDTVCDTGSAWGTARAVARFLAPAGKALMCLNSEESRFGIDAFPACLAAYGLRCSRREAPAEYAQGMAGESIMTFHLYEVGWGEGASGD